MARVNLSYRDYNREASTVSLRLEQQAATELGVGDFLAAVAAVATAVNNVSLGLHTKTTRIWEEETLAAPTAAANDINAQRERKWLCRFYDTVNFVSGSFEIPAADLSLLQPNSDYMDIESGAGLALKNAIEANVVSPAGNPIVMFEAIHVGRNT